MPSAPAPRLAALDAMRGYAILGVVLAHTAQWAPPAAGWAAQFCANGALGVQLFFVASAFALFLSQDRRRGGERHPVAGFFLRRFFRIVPMFYAGLIFFVLLAGGRPRFWAPHGVTPLDVGLTAVFLNGWHPETINAVVPGGWSIVAEVSFYLLLPLLFRLVTSRERAWLLLAGMVLLGWVAGEWLAPLLTPAYPATFAYLAENFRFFWIFGQLPVFALGIVLHFLLRDARDGSDPRPGWLSLGAAAVLGGALFRQLHPPMPPPFPAVVLYGAAFMLFGLGLNLTRSALLVNRPVLLLGRISYSLYFVHFAVFQFLFLRWPAGFPVTGPGATLLALLLVLAVAGPVSWATHRWIELPGIDLGRRWVALIEARAPGAEK